MGGAEGRGSKPKKLKTDLGVQQLRNEGPYVPEMFVVRADGSVT